MKKIIFSFLFIPLVSYGQTENKVKSPKANLTSKKTELAEKKKKS